MKNIATILLVVLFLGQSLSVAVTEVMKLGELIEHAQMHLAEYGDSFFTFLSKHYGEQQSEHTGAHKEHEDLPFHHIQGAHMIVMFLTPSHQTITHPMGLDNNSAMNSIYIESIPNFVNSEIFQPPIYS